MNKNEKPSFLKGKGAAVGVVICFVAVICLVGAYTFSNYREDINEQMAKAEEEAEQITEENTEEATTDDILIPQESDVSEYGETEEENVNTEEKEGLDTENTEGSTMSSAGTSSVWFSEESVLSWPASGAVIMGYSMDQTVFFQTLEQYQYNPAMIIAGEVGEIISASAAGIVTNIEETAETGTTVTMDMGNGYSSVYGQLADVQLSIGDYVAAGETVGALAEPTKYYSIEGPNLYFQILKDGEPVDPVKFME